ncbi:hypothetical protein ABZX28_25420 [Streptomyces rubiginosohelvolus]|uniref:hypothetical protein n=1 Tax=Streptomyces rubiginosohelvolus TaxID=67362 RepID=UPI00339E6E9D
MRMDSASRLRPQGVSPLEVLAHWAPVVQSLAVAGLIGDANQVGNDERSTLIGLARQMLGQR